LVHTSPTLLPNPGLPRYLAIIGRTSSSLITAQKEIETQHPGVLILALRTDIVDQASVNQAFETTRSTFGPIDILIANAGYLPDIVPVASADVDGFMNGFDVCKR
jgi:short-subunit dehydrogenase